MVCGDVTAKASRLQPRRAKDESALASAQGACSVPAGSFQAHSARCPRFAHRNPSVTTLHAIVPWEIRSSEAG